MSLRRGPEDRLQGHRLPPTLPHRSGQGRVPPEDGHVRQVPEAARPRHQASALPRHAPLHATPSHRSSAFLQLVQIRRALPSDAPGIARVHVESWRSTYVGIVPDDYLASLDCRERERIWRRLISYESQATYVAQHKRVGIVGFVNGGSAREDDMAYTGELYAIYLLEQQQRQGIGRRLVAERAFGCSLVPPVRTIRSYSGEPLAMRSRHLILVSMSKTTSGQWHRPPRSLNSSLNCASWFLPVLSCAGN